MMSHFQIENVHVIRMDVDENKSGQLDCVLDHSMVLFKELETF